MQTQMLAEVALRETLQRQLDVAQAHLTRLNTKLAQQQSALFSAQAELRCAHARVGRALPAVTLALPGCARNGFARLASPSCAWNWRARTRTKIALSKM